MADTTEPKSAEHWEIRKEGKSVVRRALRLVGLLGGAMVLKKADQTDTMTADSKGHRSDNRRAASLVGQWAQTSVEKTASRKAVKWGNQKADSWAGRSA